MSDPREPEKRLLEPEIVPAAFGRGGWTVVRGGHDESGAFQDWIGTNFPDYALAEVAALEWEKHEPTTHGGYFV